MTDALYREVWKFPMAETQLVIEAPGPKAVRLFANQHDAFCVWVEVTPSEPKSKAMFRVYGTGQAVPAYADWIASAITDDGNYVWHLYQLSKWEPSSTARTDAT